mgnify:FL=1
MRPLGRPDMTLKALADDRPDEGRRLLNNFELRLMARMLVEEQGLTLAQILAGTGLPRRLLTETAQLLTPEQELLLYTRIAHCNRDPGLGVRVGERIMLPNYGVLGSAMMAAYNLGEALDLLAEFAPLVSWASHSQLSTETFEGQLCTRLTIVPTATDPLTAALEIDSTFASLQVLFNELMAESVPFTVLDIARESAPDTLQQHHRLFSCPVRSGRERNALLISQSVLNAPLPHPQPEHRELLRDLCRQSTAALTEERGLVAAVRSRLQGLEDGIPTLEQLAAQFNISARTLRRQLRAAGVSFQSLLDQSRYRDARRYLGSTELTVEAIGRRLGYADARSFRTAFRRWSGMTPAQFRKG